VLVRLSDEAPLHLQIYCAFREAILSGEISPGSRLPSSRAEARTLGVSRNVVLQAYGQLEAEGYIGGASGIRAAGVGRDAGGTAAPPAL